MKTLKNVKTAGDIETKEVISFLFEISVASESNTTKYYKKRFIKPLGNFKSLVY